ncbi:MAG: aminotransferase class V-fold PLP-dependent enzyme [Candidatus Korobacteraceae bacterium]|jgi:cysteine desulfurase family protein
MIYLDNAATSWPKPPGVVRAMRQALTGSVGNPGRTSHRSAMDVADNVDECRENLAQLFGIANPLRVCFTLNTTDALNLAIQGMLSPGDHVICTSMEHNSVWRPLVALQERGVELSIAEADTCGVVNAESVRRLLRYNTRLVAIIHASNVNGAIQPVAEIGRIARASGVPMLVDAAQSAGSLPIDVEAMCIDLLAFPGHKGLLGPQGTGGLYVREGVELRPLKQGGTGSESKSPRQPSIYPDRLESGTLNIPGIAGLNAALRYLFKIGVARIAEREEELTQRLLAGLEKIDEVTIYGAALGSPRASVVSFNIRGLDPGFIADKLEIRAEIACRPGWHCAGLAHQTLGTQKTGTVRLSPGPFTKMSEIKIALQVIEEIARGK